MKWYSTKKYKPLKGCSYIVTDGDFAYTATYDICDKWIDERSQDEDEIRGVTHFGTPNPIEIEGEEI